MRELTKNILLLFIVLLVGFVVLEIIVRVFWNEPGYAYPPELFIPDNNTGYKYAPNFVGSFVSTSYGNVPIVINSKGLRDREYTYEKPKGVTRIVALGDSVSFGAGVPMEKTYWWLYEENSSIEVVNGGVNGYEFDQEVAWYKKEGYKYDPDVVVVSVVLNDPRPVNASLLMEQKFGTQPRSTVLQQEASKVCKTCKFVYRTYDSWRTTHGRSYNDIYFEQIYALWQGDAWTRYEKEVLDLNKELKKDHKKLVLVVFPYTQQFVNAENVGRTPQEQLQSLKAKGITVIDMQPYLDVPNYQRYYLLGDNLHLSEEGNAVVADALYKELEVR